MMNDLAPELCRRKRDAWEAFKSIEGAVKKKKNIRLHAHLFDTAVLPALTHANAEGNPEFREPQRTEIKDVVVYGKKAKIRWAGQVMRYRDDRWTRAVTYWNTQKVEQTPGRYFFMKALK
uniref:Transposase n=1 Tax=Haemonchus contortus TaxID=6289 RepID=A0A7I5E7Y9_HAECO